MIGFKIVALLKWWEEIVKFGSIPNPKQLPEDRNLEKLLLCYSGIMILNTDEHRLSKTHRLFSLGRNHRNRFITLARRLFCWVFNVRSYQWSVYLPVLSNRPNFSVDFFESFSWRLVICPDARHASPAFKRTILNYFCVHLWITRKNSTIIYNNTFGSRCDELLRFIKPS